jgi:tryptophanyl-tRNA synthetase
MQSKERVFSGIQPSGNLHVGNYVGALKNWVAMQNEYENFFCIVDLHAITVPQDPKVLRQKIREVAAIYLASGLDPERCVIFRQSKVSGHAELCWLLNSGVESASAGLFDYPVLQAADVLLYNAHLVPVGEDQRQHLELMRTLARRFNHLYGETFVVPEAMIPPTGARVMALDAPEEKMSKSSPRPGSYVAILDDPDSIRKKIRRAKTDSGTEILASQDKPAITNLLDVYSAMSGEPVSGIEADYAGKGYGDLKKDLAEVVVEGLAPVRDRAYELLDDPAELDRLLDSGARRAQDVALPNLESARARLGLD